MVCADGGERKHEAVSKYEKAEKYIFIREIYFSAGGFIFFKNFSEPVALSTVVI